MQRAQRAVALVCVSLLLVATAGATTTKAVAGRKPNPWFEAGQKRSAQAEAHAREPARARNLILFVGDGMGISTISAARIFAGQQHGGAGEAHRLSFERFPHLGLVKVYNTDQQVPDSAGTMTAICSGVKTKAGVLGVDESVVFDDYTSVEQSRVSTLFEQAEARGIKTGLVSTARLTHATPAACYAHAPNRAWENDAALPDAARRAGFPDLARQLLEFPHGDGIDVMLGGGRNNFVAATSPGPGQTLPPTNRLDARVLPIIWRHKTEGRVYLTTARALDALDLARTRQLLGLFAPEHLSFALDRAAATSAEPSLPQMTEVALRLLQLENAPQGFVLLVEGGRIDHAHHLNNAHRALVETIELSKAVVRALELSDPAKTLVVVTADHSHPLTLAGYATRGNPILGWVNENDAATQKPTLARDGFGQPYSTLQYAAGPGNEAPSDAQPAGAKRFPHLPNRWRHPWRQTTPATSDPDPQAADHLQNAGVPLSIGVHSGEDVAVYATGPGAYLFGGVLEQSALYHLMVRALGWNDDGGGD